MTNQLTHPKVTVIDPAAPEKVRLRVAAYCRVSSDSDDQLNSYLAQVDYYTRHISDNPDWELADIYADGPVIIALNQQTLATSGVALI